MINSEQRKGMIDLVALYWVYGSMSIAFAYQE